MINKRTVSVVGAFLAIGFFVLTPGTAKAAPVNGELLLKDGTVYKIEDAKWRPFRSPEVFYSCGYKFFQTRSAMQEDLNSFKEGSVMVYCDGTLIKGPNNPAVYLVTSNSSGTIKKPFSSAKAFLELGYRFPQVVIAPEQTFFDVEKEGPVIDTAEKPHDVGAVLNYNGTLYEYKPNGFVVYKTPQDYLSYHKTYDIAVPANSYDISKLQEAGTATERTVYSATASSQAVFYLGGADSTTRISSAVCGTQYTLKVDNYTGTSAWLVQYKNTPQYYNNSISLPNIYTSVCGKDEGGYVNTLYTDSTKTVKIGEPVSFDVLAKSTTIQPHVPSIPTVTGSKSFVKDSSQTFTFMSTDSDGDSLTYTIDWHDGGELVTRAGNSGLAVTASHAYTKEGTFALRVKVADPVGNYAETIYAVTVEETQSATLAVTTNDPTDKTSTNATLNGTVVGKSSGYLYFEYGTSQTAMYDLTPFMTDTTEATSRTFKATISNLKADTTYYFRAAAGSDFSGNPVKGEIKNFKTLASATTLPTVTTGSATNNISTGATLNGTVSSATTVTNVYFLYGQNGVLDKSAQGTGTTASNFNAVLKGLDANTAYSYQAYGVNANGTGKGDIETFTTKSTTAVNHNPYYQSSYLTPAKVVVNVAATLDVSFFDPDFDQMIYSVDWNDGSANSVSARTYGNYVVPHTWTAAKTYLVSITVEDGQGGKGTFSYLVVVEPSL